MRAVIILLALVLIFALVGWITFSKGPDRASITIESGQIREDTKKAMESGGELLRKAGDKVQYEAKKPTERTTTPSTTPSPATPETPATESPTTPQTAPATPEPAPITR